ncbi:dihydrodipicolinate synthase family protein [Rahnella selenatireducens]|uniref:dihydrodipicolinate synthase family protein n=1 Tax=Rahnella selenatireducens TaxID=3389797 RepID=UPI0039693049
MLRPSGVISAMLTPWCGGKPDLQTLREITEFQIAGGLTALFPVSSVGEAGYMSYNQKCEVVATVVEQAKGRVPVWAGIPATTPEESINLAHAAERAGASGVVLMPASFYHYDAATHAQYFNQVASAVNLPLCLYNIPFFADPLSAETVAELAAHPNIVGIKDSSGDAVGFMKMMAFCPQAEGEFSLMTGREEFFYASLCAGGKGSITGTAGVLPEVMRRIYDLFCASQLKEARALQLAAIPVMSMMASLPFPLGYKLAMSLRGFNMGENKVPVTRETQNKIENLREVLNKEITLLLSSVK